MSTNDGIYDYYLNECTLESFEAWKKAQLSDEKKRKKFNEAKDKEKMWLEDVYIIPLAKKKKEMVERAEKEIFSEFYPSRNLLSHLPQNTVLITVSFTLKKPYISKGEGEFNLINPDDTNITNNPIVRDKLTGLPMVRSTSWKGHLRFAAEKVKKDAYEEKIINRLFGPAGEDGELNKGRLRFFPTFFEKNAAKEDVITPLSRENRTPVKGKSPIKLEVIPKETKGELHILYFPYPKGRDYREDEVGEDLKFLSKALAAMLFQYGFSAKKTSGFGVINSLNESDVSVFPEKYQDYFKVLYSDKSGQEGGA